SVRNGRHGALDANRIAILPFRTAGSDLSLLKDGLVELLSLEFNGEVGPIAVDAGASERAWQNGSGDAAPTSVAIARRAAKSLGAGRVLLGSVAGTASRYTISASVIDVSSGAMVVPTTHVSSNMDSLPEAIAELSARLLSHTPGAW